jgi:anti-sigma factor RsiW
MRGMDRHLRRASVERDLARLADGSLDPSDRDRVERLVAGSPELQARLREQRFAVDATRSVVQRERAPLTLRIHRRTLAGRARPRPRGRTPLFALGAIGTAGAVVWTIAVLAGSQAGLTVAQAATLAARPATIAVSEPPDQGVTIPHLRVAGLPFPYWEDHFAWRATGARSDRLDGRDAATVFYRRDGESVAYTIVSGGSLPAAAGARTLVRAGTVLAVYPPTRGVRVVTWLRRGHTCVLSGRNVPLDALLKLAAWRGRGRIPF